MLVEFDNLPEEVQALFLNGRHRGQEELKNIEFTQTNMSSYNGIYIAPSLCYDFHESNFTLHTINLTQVAELDVGPCMAEAFVKTDDALPSFIVVDGERGDTDYQVYICV